MFTVRRILITIACAGTLIAAPGVVSADSAHALNMTRCPAPCG